MVCKAPVHSSKYTKTLPAILEGFFNTTYTRVANLGQYFSSKMSIRLIHESTYMRVYTVKEKEAEQSACLPRLINALSKKHI